MMTKKHQDYQNIRDDEARQNNENEEELEVFQVKEFDYK